MKRIKWTSETLKQKLMSLFGDDYEYDFVDYKNVHTKVLVYCKKHGLFSSRPNDLLNGHGCPRCNLQKGCNARRDTFDEMVAKIKMVHGDKYIIPQQDYVNDKTKIKVICKKHGVFETRPSSLKRGKCCKLCVKENISKKFSMATKEFKHKFLDAYGYEKYDLSKVDLTKKDELGRITLICHKKFKDGTEHGEFKMTPNNVLRLHGCPCCKQSRLEHKMTSILLKNKIKFIYQCNRTTLSWVGSQSLDFFLPDFNIAIECQGGGHFLPIEAFGGEEEFRKRIISDENKRRLCTENGVKLLYFTNIKKYIDNETIFDENEIVKQIVGHGKTKDRNQ